MLRKLQKGADARRAKIARVRDALQDGTYENSLKLHVTADRLLDEL